MVVIVDILATWTQTSLLSRQSLVSFGQLCFSHRSVVYYNQPQCLIWVRTRLPSPFIFVFSFKLNRNHEIHSAISLGRLHYHCQTTLIQQQQHQFVLWNSETDACCCVACCWFLSAISLRLDVWPAMKCFADVCITSDSNLDNWA